MLAGGEDINHYGRQGPIQAETTTPRILAALSFVMEKMVARNEQLVLQLNQQQDGQSCGGGSAGIGTGLKAFHGVRAPSISIPKYLERIYKYTNCSPSCFVVGYVYIDRLTHKHPDSLVVSLNVHRLLVTSVMVASKILDDVHYNNAFYARVGGVSNVELNRLELELLSLLDFGVMISSRIFETYCQHLEKEMMMLNSGATQTTERPLLPLMMPNPANNNDAIVEISVVEEPAHSSSSTTNDD